MESFHFSVSDYAVGIMVLLVPVLIGCVFAVKDKDRVTRQEYLLGGRRMNLLPVAMSIFITFASAVSQIGIPAEVYMYGSMYIIMGIGISLSYIVGVFTLVPLVYPLGLTSMYEYLLLRYRSNAVRMLSTVIGMMTTILYMAIALLSPALALEASAGIPLWMSIVLVGGVGTIYTTIGGIKSVIWTDAFQTIIVFVGIFTMIVKGVLEVGSVSEVFAISQKGERTTLDTLGPDPRTRHTYLGCLIGGMFMMLVNGFNQSTVQRINSMKNLKKAKQSYCILIPFALIYNFILVIVGNIIYAYFANKRCDPYEAGSISNRNQVAPFFVLDAMNDLPGMAGLYVATLCCGSLSTLSSGINALAANTVEDILRNPLKTFSERAITRIVKLSALIHGTVIVGIAYGAQFLHGPVTQMVNTIFGAFGSPILGIFLLGASVPWANKYGAAFGAIGSLTFNIWVSVGSRLYGRKLIQLDSVPVDGCLVNQTSLETSYHNITLMLESSHVENTTTSQFSFILYDISYEWYSVLGCLLCIILGLLVSYLTKSLMSGKPTTDGKLIFPFLRTFWEMDDKVGTSNTILHAFDGDITHL